MTEWEEEDAVRRLLPIFLDENGSLPMRVMHLANAIDRLNRKGEIVMLSNGIGARWAKSVPGTWP
jgi:hypothetical protein